MSCLLEDVIRVVLIGIGATAVMDLWQIVLKILKIPTLNFALIGRWVGHIYRGKWFHDGIAKAEPIKNELVIGWLTHYGIGVVFAGLLVSIFGSEWARNPTFIPAVAIGITTVVAPLFIMQPAFGSGIAFSKTTTPLRSCMKSVVNHTVFGCGLYIAAALLTHWH
jgi:hypothetical protein